MRPPTTVVLQTVNLPFREQANISYSRASRYNREQFWTRGLESRGETRAELAV